MTTATLETVDRLYADAAAKAAANPPGRVLATIVLAVFSAIGWVWGRAWTSLWFIGQAVAYGYKQGNKIPRPPAPQEPPAGAQPGYM